MDPAPTRHGVAPAGERPLASSVPQDAKPHPPLHTGSPAAALARSWNEQQDRLRSLHHISFDGRVYHYRGFRYERLDDAIRYAELLAARGEHAAAGEADIPAQGVPAQVADAVAWPTAEEMELMGALSISFDQGVFHFGEYRYDRLSDAVNYARLIRSRAAPDSP
ncbi:hypothetical protein [Eleftheria terrae]|uniref:hypothetical protein n=1 Tax=Eleftheria terrae TaxID=1597781 RepID=UPI00263B314C|nr:hypothetical protein [Eleftheria terrae]WKB55846.1 hypothetical protein N7L95_27595 [Eleftheria terrae]